MSEKQNKDKKETTYNLSEEVKGLFEGVEVSDEMNEKISTILEAVVTSKVSEREQELQEQMAQKLDEAKSEHYDELNASVHKYLDYVVTEWMEENKLAVESGIRNQVSESFMDGLKELFSEHWIEVPEGKEDALAIAEQKVSELETKLHESIEKVDGLKGEVEEFERQNVMETYYDGLADTQKEKLDSLVEGIEYTNKEAFDKKVKTIRESFFKEGKDEDDEEDDDMKKKDDKKKDKEDVKESRSRMDSYLKALKG